MIWTQAADAIARLTLIISISAGATESPDSTCDDIRHQPNTSFTRPLLPSEPEVDWEDTAASYESAMLARREVFAARSILLELQGDARLIKGYCDSLDEACNNFLRAFAVDSLAKRTLVMRSFADHLRGLRVSFLEDLEHYETWERVALAIGEEAIVPDRFIQHALPSVEDEELAWTEIDDRVWS